MMMILKRLNFAHAVMITVRKCEDIDGKDIDDLLQSF